MRKILREHSELKPKKSGLIIKNKRLSILSPRELTVYVNLPTALNTLFIKTATTILDPPSELIKDE